MLKHTPYAGAHPLFRIGLEPLDLDDWIDVDDHLAHYLQEKARLKKRYRENVFVAEEATLAAQQEVLDLLAAYLPERFRQVYRLSDGGAEMEIIPARRTVRLDQAGVPPLEIASQLVQEDLVIMRKGEAGWRLAAASLCFPSSWHLLEKFSRPLHAIHEPVPGFGPGTRNATMIERIFDNIKTELPMRRFNWSVYSDDELFHADKEAENIRESDLSAGAFLRVEHQTLRKLPVSGDILFTVRIHLDPLEALAAHPQRTEICQGFIASLKVLDANELAYKGLSGQVDGLIGRLETMAAEGAPA